MQLPRNLKPRQLGPLEIILFAIVLGAIFLTAFVGTSFAVIRGRATSIPTQVARLSTHTPTATITATATRRVTATAEIVIIVPDTATPTATITPYVPPSATPLPTGWFVASANPTPISTPALPAAADFPESCDGPGRINILLIGVDGRGNNFRGRSDSIMLVGVNFGDRSAQVLSLPRDLWVQVPEYGGDPLLEGRINTAFPRGGPELLGQTITHNFGLRIDRYIIANFTAFEDAIDAVGGIDVFLDTAIRDDEYPMDDGTGNTMVLDIPAGWVHMDGEVALMYSRTRHQDSDFGRMKRQQKVMLAIRDKLLSPDVLPALPGLAQLAYQSVQSNLSLADIGLLGCVGPQIDPASISRIIIDQQMTTNFTTTDGAQVLAPDMDAIIPVLEVFNEGE